MLTRLLILPIAFWLLLPPGVCLCHLPEAALAKLRGQPEPKEDPCHDHEHGGCPCMKKTDCHHHRETCERPDGQTPVTVFCDLPAPSLIHSAEPRVAVRSLDVRPPASSLYLDHCALRL